MRKYKSIDELISDFIANNIFMTIEEAEELRDCSLVIEDILPSGSYEELANGEILVY